MKLNDRVYGKIEIKEPVLVELIHSKPIQRLKKINQHGISEIKGKIITRYDHSVGVALLLKRYNASLEEQIAGLLHDVPHTAFSHIVDFAVGTYSSQTFHEKFMKQLIFQSEIPSILKKHKFDVNRVVDKSKFPLSEAPLPNLCADRIDYFLRDSIYYWGPYPEIKEFLAHLKVYKANFVFDDLNVAKKFALKFMDISINLYVGATTLTKFSILAQTIKQALKIGVLKEKDLFETDDLVLKKLKAAGDKQLKENLDLIKPKIHFKQVEEGYDFQVRGKIRYVDPKVLINNKKLVKLSRLDASFREIIPLFKEKVRAGHKIKILR